MESLGTGRKGAQRGRMRQEGAFPLPAPVPSDSIAGPPKKGKKSLAYPPSPSENGCLGCIIEGRTAITTPPKPL